MWLFVVVEPKVSIQAGNEIHDSLVILDVNVLVFECSPESFNQDVVKDAATAVHADLDPGIFEPAGERFAGKLAALISVEDLWLSMRQSLLKRFQTELGIQSVRQSPGKHAAAVPVHNGHQIDETMGKPDVGDISTPDLVRTVYRQVF